jgi:hypothetical protein
MREKSARGLPPAADPAGIALPCSTWNEAGGYGRTRRAGPTARVEAGLRPRPPLPSHPRADGWSATPGGRTAKASTPTGAGAAIDRQRAPVDAQRDLPVGGVSSSLRSSWWQPYPKSRHGGSGVPRGTPAPVRRDAWPQRSGSRSRRARQRLTVRRGTCLRRDTRSQSRDPGWTECPRGAAWCRAPSHVTVPQPTGASASRRSACVPCPGRGSGSCCWSR